MKSLSQIAEIIKSKDKIYIFTHRSADGDAIGSACGLCEILRKMGKKSCVVYSKPVSWKYDFLDKYRNTGAFEPEYIISVDLADISLLPEDNISYGDKIDMCIDHHISNTNYADITFVDSSAAATAEIIYLIAKAMGVEIDAEIGKYIYTGIATDTGCFKYSNVTARTHRIAAELMEKGIEVSQINSILFDTKLKSLIQLEGMIYRGIEYFYKGKCAIVCVTLDMLEKTGIDDSELEEIASIPRSVEGVSIGITIKEKEDGICKVSVRTKEGISARRICSAYGGGGHECTGGCKIKGGVYEVKEKIVKLIGKELGW